MQLRALSTCLLTLTVALGTVACGGDRETDEGATATMEATPVVEAAVEAPPAATADGLDPMEQQLLADVQAALTAAGYDDLEVEIRDKAVHVAGTGYDAEKQQSVKAIVEPLAFDKMYSAAFSFSN